MNSLLPAHQLLKCSFHNFLDSQAINIPHGEILDVVVLQNIAGEWNKENHYWHKLKSS